LERDFGSRERRSVVLGNPHGHPSAMNLGCSFLPLEVSLLRSLLGTRVPSAIRAVRLSRFIAACRRLLRTRTLAKIARMQFLLIKGPLISGLRESSQRVYELPTCWEISGCSNNFDGSDFHRRRIRALLEIRRVFLLGSSQFRNMRRADSWKADESRRESFQFASTSRAIIRCSPNLRAPFQAKCKPHGWKLESFGNLSKVRLQGSIAVSELAYNEPAWPLLFVLHLFTLNR